MPYAGGRRRPAPRTPSGDLEAYVAAQPPPTVEIPPSTGITAPVR